jgi:hypothetical protein
MMGYGRRWIAEPSFSTKVRVNSLKPGEELKPEKLSHKA